MKRFRTASLCFAGSSNSSSVSGIPMSANKWRISLFFNEGKENENCWVASIFVLIQLIYQQGPSKLPVVLYNTNGRISFFTTFQSIIEPVPYLVRKLYRTFRYDRNTGSSTWKIDSTTVVLQYRYTYGTTYFLRFLPSRFDARTVLP